MKKNATKLLSFIFFLLSFNLFSQPQGFNYQAVVLNASGNVVASHLVGFRFSILDSGGSSAYTETQSATTNAQGMVSLVIGAGTLVSGDFTTIDWSVGGYSLKVEMDPAGGTNYTLTDTKLLQSVPYALYAMDADADSTNELQTLSVEGTNLSISKGNAVPFPAGSYLWTESGGNIYRDNGNVGIGSITPIGKLEVKGDAAQNDEVPLFEVKRQDGYSVFAVYPDGVRINVQDLPGKGSKSGFAVGGFNPAKGFTGEFFRVTPDSVRIYINDSAKGSKGGFAVGGINPAKANLKEYLRVTRDSTRVYIADSLANGFSVSNIQNGRFDNLMDLTTFNYFIGHQSGKKTKAVGMYNGIYNTFFGYQTGLNNTSGFNNIFIGYKAGYNNTTGPYNIFIGNKAGFNNQAGWNNTFIGESSGTGNTNGRYNTFLGYKTGIVTDTAFYNTYIGCHAGYWNYGSRNTYVGYGTGMTGATFGNGSRNSYLGCFAGLATTSGSDNSFFGTSSGRRTLTGSRNVFAGVNSGFMNERGNNNVFIGYLAGYTNIGGTTVPADPTGGSSNVFVGSEAGYKNYTGKEGTFVGCQAGYNNTTSGNSFFGFQSGYTHSLNGGNTFIGHQTGYSSTSSSNNTYLGYHAGYANQTGAQNVYLGSYAGQSGTAGSYNVLIGTYAGMNAAGSGNIMIGRSSGSTNTAGNNNVFLGYYAGQNETGSNRLYIDNSNTTSPLIYGEFDNNLLKFNGDVQVSSTSTVVTGIKFLNTTVSNQYIIQMCGSGVTGRVGNFEIWNSQLGTNLITFTPAANVGFGVTSISHKIDVAGGAYCTGTTWVNSSDKNLKENYAEVNGKEIVEKLEALPILSWNFKADDPSIRHIGPVAQDFYAAFGLGNDNTTISTVDPSGLALAAIQELVKENKEQQQIIEEQKNKMSELEKRLEKMEERLGGVAKEK
jgi:hypothetical protein